MDLDITGIAHGGFGVARDGDGRVVFVADAIPGERVRAVLTEEKKTYVRAVAVEVLEASPHRVPHIWAEAAIDRAPEDRVGGADYGHIALAHQRELKAEVLRDSPLRFGGIDTVQRAFQPTDLGLIVEAAPGDDERGGLHWRTRVRLHRAEDGTVGPYAARSHRVIPVADYPLTAPDAIEIVEDREPRVVVERVGDRDFRVDDTGFWQVHREAPRLLRRQVQAMVDGESYLPPADNLDLYGGVGLLASVLGDVGGPDTRVTSVESDPRATRHAAENLAEWPGAAAETARVDRWLARAIREGRRFDGATIILDPPRSGAGQGVAEMLTSVGAAQLVYVACDPVALARDARVIEASGYRMEWLQGFDLFPHTHHLEAIATFLRG